ncbi:hypothetical protein BHE90_000904 [Fusarium euwallaceae]|uniref:Uncharacterized protein n=1 Tax=Fusarium euwallaceae TaxID=1147111 RepID=A0A430M9D7_9HYPO|nr:hypothetical protein BHE90_000904 [Fusarium euwallaceae]
MPKKGGFFSDSLVNQIVQLLLTYEGSLKKLHQLLSQLIPNNSWSQALAQAILQRLTKLIKEGAKMGKTMADAVKKATDEAKRFAKEQPVWTTLIAAGTIIAIGVLAIYGLPWILKALGFTAKGPLHASRLVGRVR